ncbi:MAG: electron transfer flavoprotein beta subunit/FixA family protein [Spirochaetales bacterium]|nr:MAG: electron transfer flavoprotein beta subunit/FixA family protein [Spirochaetales bacterium]
MALTIAVCIKPVPDSEYYNKITIDPVTKRLNRDGIPTVINSMDKNAIEAALRLREKHGGRVLAFSMAPDTAIENLKRVLAMGVDEAYLCSDRVLGGADTWATSYTLYKAIEKTGPVDLVIMGNQTEDGGTAQVPSQLGEWMGVPHLANVIALDYEDGGMVVKTKADRGTIRYSLKLPAVLAVTRDCNEPRIPSVMDILKVGKKPMRILRAQDLDLNPDFIGIKGSPTQAGEIYSPDMSRKSEALVGDPDEIALRILDELRKAGISIG